MSSRSRPDGRGVNPAHRGLRAQAAAVKAVWPVNERADALDAPDWTTWRKCPMCFAETGEPCMTITVGGPSALPEIPMRVAHSTRRRRTGANGA